MIRDGLVTAAAADNSQRTIRDETQSAVSGVTLVSPMGYMCVSVDGGGTTTGMVTFYVMHRQSADPIPADLTEAALQALGEDLWFFVTVPVGAGSASVVQFQFRTKRTFRPGDRLVIVSKRNLSGATAIFEGLSLMLIRVGD